MTDTWVLKRLDQVAKVVGGGTPSTKNSDNFGETVPWVTPKDLSGHRSRYISRGERSLSSEGLAGSSARLLPPGTVLVSSRAPIGLTAIAEVALATNQGCRSLVPDPAQVDSVFLYYLMSASTDVLHQHANGTTFQELPGGVMKTLEFLFPPLDEQVRIAQVLATLDDAIAAAVATIDLVDVAVTAAASVALNESPTTQTAKLTDLVSITNGYSYSSSELVDESATAMVNLKNFGRTGGFRLDGLKPIEAQFKAAQELFPGDLMVAKTDLTQNAEVIGRCLRMPAVPPFSRYVASLDVAILRPIADQPASVLLGLLSLPEFRYHCLGYTNGTTVLHLGKSALPAYDITLPDAEWAAWLAERVDAYTRLQDSALAKLSALSDLKRFVMPRLVSGELRVAEARQLVGAAS